jgi:hypothetical protein
MEDQEMIFAAEEEDNFMLKMTRTMDYRRNTYIEPPGATQDEEEAKNVEE